MCGPDALKPRTTLKAARRDYLDAALFLLLQWLPSAGSWTYGKSTTLPALSSAARRNLFHLR